MQKTNKDKKRSRFTNIENKPVVTMGDGGKQCRDTSVKYVTTSEIYELALVLGK